MGVTNLSHELESQLGGVMKMSHEKIGGICNGYPEGSNKLIT